MYINWLGWATKPPYFFIDSWLIVGMRINWLLAGEVELDGMVINPGVSGIQLQVHKSIMESTFITTSRSWVRSFVYTG